LLEYCGNVAFLDFTREEEIDQGGDLGKILVCAWTFIDQSDGVAGVEQVV
jgi:hypothetical protein